jgi:hypothetical protein
MAHCTDHVGISCHDFRANWGEEDSFRSRDDVTSWLLQAGFSISTRSDSRSWIRDCVYGSFIGVRVNADFSSRAERSGDAP